MIVLDTHVLLWLDRGDAKLGEATRLLIDQAHQAGDLAVSAISFWETAMLLRKGRIELGISVDPWRQAFLASGLREIAVDGAVGIAAVALDGFHGDPADRLITATALLEGATLLTADQEILDWKGPLRRQDASQ